ncbi:hypothetical protein [Desertivirga brevis]|uniref:hypothetical protein n=1 Tax=Desertivirga brevis TaxID=2810310 RepID=UPI001A95666D|nr:hypothetical protein [Pedobacter sp. SYSU D00873]
MSSLNVPAIYALKIARKAYGKLFDGAKFTNVKSFSPDQYASTLIEEGLRGDKPFMVGRLGAVELSSIANYYSVKNHRNNFLGYIKGDSEAFWWDNNTLQNMSNNAGFFPSTPQNLEKFAKLMLDDMSQLDILGSWLWQEKLFDNYLSHAKKISLFDLEPYNHTNPWSYALEGRTVLVVHPFVDSIRQQYTRRELLFPNPKVLPHFELKTIRAIQSIANNYTGFKDWFEALNYMKDQISNTEFDVAIIGCGAYGFPLAAHVKRMGKKAVHLGGATQTLFGVKGKRWEEQKEHQIVAQMMNEHWIRPLSSETPEGIQKVEGGCYW